MKTFYWLWSIPAVIIAAAGIAGNQHLMAVAIGLAGSLSLSGSI